MKIWIHRYQLQPLLRLNSFSGDQTREGALIRVEYPDLGCVGHADIHPWVELGDEPLEKQLLKLSNQMTTPLTKQSLYLAREEALARQLGKSLFQGSVHLKNNFTITDALNFDLKSLEQIQSQGFEVLKLKAGIYPSPEFSIIKAAQRLGLRVRLDFNAKLNKFAFEDYFKHFSTDLLCGVEYIEDPFTYDPVSWNRLNQQVPLALDNEIKALPGFLEGEFKMTEKDFGAFSVLVVKPARVNVDKALEQSGAKTLKITVTSYMDHPVGVLHAWGQALKVKEKFPHQGLQAGCATYGLYKPDDFSQSISMQEAMIVAPTGLGLGLDSLWEKLPWQPI